MARQLVRRLARLDLASLARLAESQAFLALLRQALEALEVFPLLLLAEELESLGLVRRLAEWAPQAPGGQLVVGELAELLVPQLVRLGEKERLESVWLALLVRRLAEYLQVDLELDPD